MDKRNDAAKPKKKSLWALLKESMDKASSGCGPGCGCHARKPHQTDQQGSTPADTADDGRQA